MGGFEAEREMAANRHRNDAFGVVRDAADQLSTDRL